jgi:N,N'-diacetyllegionaminate synthase
VGLSDRTHRISAGVAAATLGATLIEKRATFSRALHGGSLGHSMEPAQFRDYCENLESVWNTLDNPVDKDNLTAYSEMKSIFEKSLVSAHDLYRGLLIEREHLAAKRPGSGISTFEIDKVLGKRLKFDILPDTLISWDMLE